MLQDITSQQIYSSLVEARNAKKASAKTNQGLNSTNAALAKDSFELAENTENAQKKKPSFFEKIKNFFKKEDKENKADVVAQTTDTSIIEEANNPESAAAAELQDISTLEEMKRLSENTEL